jgi:RNA-directed DNA polymerase
VKRPPAGGAIVIHLGPRPESVPSRGSLRNCAQTRTAPGRIDEERIPKEGGKIRVISIPAIRDRVVQGALRLLLEPIFEADFSDSSFGARPRRSAHEAIEKAGLRQRRHRVVDVDLSRYFDTIRHDRMLAKVARRVEDGKVLAMVKQFLTSTGDRGVPQGSPLSGMSRSPLKFA